MVRGKETNREKAKIPAHSLLRVVRRNHIGVPRFPEFAGPHATRLNIANFRDSRGDSTAIHTAQLDNEKQPKHKDRKARTTREQRRPTAKKQRYQTRKTNKNVRWAPYGTWFVERRPTLKKQR